MKLYHYTNLSNWQDVKSGEVYREDPPGLSPRRRIGQHGEAWEQGAVFCLTDPLPQEWINNVEFKNIWQHLKRNIGKLLLEIEVDENEDGIYVIDRGHIEGLLYPDKKGIPGKYLHDGREEADEKYWGEKINLSEFVHNKDAHHFSLPEVVVTKHIPLEKISVAKEQPLIREYLEEHKNHKPTIERFMRQIQEVPELEELFKKYQNIESVQEFNKNLKLR